ncbi:alpha/beta fold hydrolase [Paenibacillus kobensis]|uniref:alpha/beta fold hydrolase n=1 Tax=Paenibacillus kobensis TaxID=59841 RepID=UPI0013E3A603|nr:alpha/beta hydrolase [Paenibacillus kobensis]
MNTVESRILRFNKAQISYSISTEHRLHTILMLHAAFADRQMFEQPLNRFKNDYRVIAIDMPGHGGTVTKGTSVTMDQMPAIVQQLLAQHGIDHCHLIGVSMGSLVAQAVADRHPELVRSVTIVGGYSIHKANKHILKMQRRESMRWLLFILFSMKRFRSYVTTVSCRSEQGQAIFAEAMKRFNRSSFTAMSGMNRLFVPSDKPVTYPLHIMYGEYDLPIAKDAAVSLHELEPESKLTMLQGAGHCANLDEPLSFNDAAEHFIRSVSMPMS